MATVRKARPRKSRHVRLRAGSATLNASDLKGLRSAWRSRQLVLFLGAGVSIPYGLPSWKNLVLELLFEQAERTRRLGRLWPHYRRALASWMTDYFDYDPLVLARMVERNLRPPSSPTPGGPGRRSGSDNPFLEQLRTHLYANYHVPRERTILNAVGELIQKNSTRSGVDSVVTFNFDNLLEDELTRRRIEVQPITSRDRQGGRGLRVIHPHGFIPRNGPLWRDNIVFTEPDYHKLTESVFHWGLSEIIDRLRKNTVLFIGLSMSDPSLRRLLDASRNSEIPPHWQIQKRHEIRDHETLEAMQEVERRARAYAEFLGQGFDERKKPDELQGAIEDALLQADTYDREVFESMGVKTIWIDGFHQIPDILGAIPNN